MAPQISWLCILKCKICLFHCFYAFVNGCSCPFPLGPILIEVMIKIIFTFFLFFACQLVLPENEDLFGVRILIFFFFFFFFFLRGGGGGEMSAQNFSAPLLKDPRPPPPVPPYWQNPSYATGYTGWQSPPLTIHSGITPQDSNSKIIVHLLYQIYQKLYVSWQVTNQLLPSTLSSSPSSLERT